MSRATIAARAGAVLSMLLLASAATAHVPAMKGRLVDLVNQSDLVVVGTVESVNAVSGNKRLWDDAVRVDETFIGEAPTKRIMVRSQTRLTADRRFVLFLRRSGDGYECLQPTGAVFPSRAEDDAGYRETVTAIQRGLRVPANDRAQALTGALIPALSAQSQQLRYQAVLEIAALAHHGLSDPQRRSLEQLAAQPDADPAVKALVKGLPAAPAASEPQVTHP